MKHQMKIMVARPNETPISIAEFKKLSRFEQMFGRWFGKTQRLMVIVPEDSVKEIKIKEVKPKNASKNQTL
ncbi:MAG: hypothetical protein LBR79_07205 [Oscillospiraceae bacterium]|jgi:hypothetical protein|nr:hypothetical protein [Oscillospiraceae bacterium]